MVEHNHIFKPEHAEKLISAERKEMLPAEDIIKIMNIREQDIVADFGAGNGYFTIPIAERTKESVYAIDAEPKMLDLLKNRCNQQGITTIKPIHAAIDDTPIKNASVDKVLISRTIHHALSVEKTLQEIKRILKPNGTLCIIEFYKDATKYGPPMEMRISPEEMSQMLDKAGYSSTISELNEIEYAVNAHIVK